MFTGIVEELGDVIGVEELPDASRIEIRASLVTSDVAVGDSISVNGVCLTVMSVDSGTDVESAAFRADVMQETLQRSNLGQLVAGSMVNLERPLTLQDRLGGHLVQGHVDGTGQVMSKSSSEHWEVVEVSLPPGLTRYLVEKGSVTIDGVSLTVASVAGDRFTVSLIPTTLIRTTLGQRRVGDLVNIEVDVLAKYVERLMSSQEAT